MFAASDMIPWPLVHHLGPLTHLGVLVTVSFGGMFSNSQCSISALLWLSSSGATCNRQGRVTKAGRLKLSLPVAANAAVALLLWRIHYMA